MESDGFVDSPDVDEKLYTPPVSTPYKQYAVIDVSGVCDEVAVDVIVAVVSVGLNKYQISACWSNPLLIFPALVKDSVVFHLTVAIESPESPTPINAIKTLLAVLFTVKDAVVQVLASATPVTTELMDIAIFYLIKI